MARYVLGESSARKFRELCAGKSAGGRREAAGAAVAFDADFPPPFTVQWAASLGSWLIWLPADNLLTVGVENVDVASALTAAEGYPSGWYVLDALDSTGGELLIEVVRDDEGEISASFKVAPGDDDTEGVVCRATVAVVERSTESGIVSVRQCIDSAIVFVDGATADGDSIDANGGEDENALQLAHFADSERDSGKGLASRLSVKDGEITAEDDGLMLVARKDGKLIYIPMSGDGEDPDASDEGDHSDPCDHPGDKGKAGGVAADEDDEHSAGGVAGGGDGGVSASGGVHPGDDNCNCD